MLVLMVLFLLSILTNIILDTHHATLIMHIPKKRLGIDIALIILFIICLAKII